MDHRHDIPRNREPQENSGKTMDLLSETTMEHRIVQLDLSSPAKLSFAVAEVFSTDKGQLVDYALNGACITAESPSQIGSELELTRLATEKPVTIGDAFSRELNFPNSSSAVALRGG